MKARLLTLVLILAPLAQSFACQSCFGDYRGVKGGPPPSIQHMAAAVWVMVGVIMSVLGGIGAFSFQLWRHANTPLEPHQQLAEEDLGKYE
ncbi:MAG: hypothetical protein ACJ8KU_06485 [Chthoniobacterales bacterium]